MRHGYGNTQCRVLPERVGSRRKTLVDHSPFATGVIPSLRGSVNEAPQGVSKWAEPGRSRVPQEGGSRSSLVLHRTHELEE